MPSLTDRSLHRRQGDGRGDIGTVTVWVAVLLLALSESLTCTDTMLDAGPSAKVHTKLPTRSGRRTSSRLDAVGAAARPTQQLNVSAPGSVMVKL